jgi:hypothetical protein
MPLLAVLACLLATTATACSVESSLSTAGGGELTADQYSWCQSHFVHESLVEPGATANYETVFVDETAAELGLVAPDGGDVMAYWLNTYVGEDADDWGKSPSPHWDAAYAKLARDPLFIRACQAAYDKRATK